MYDVIIVGAGPAGIMASIIASKRGRKVLLIEKNSNIGKKLMITGGGRCNLTNQKKVKEFIDNLPANGKALYSSLSVFGPNEIVDYFEELNVPLKMEEEDKIFPISNKADDIVSVLKKQLKKYNVEILCNSKVIDIKNDLIKTVITEKSEYKTKKIVIATGGKSFPKTGSNGDGYMFAKKMKQPLTKLYPAETFLKTKDKYPVEGITLDDVAIEYDKKVSRGSILFTHSGITGPSVFKISEYVYLGYKNNSVISIDLLPEKTKENLNNIVKNYNQKKEIKSFLREILPDRFGDFLLDYLNIDSTIKIASLSSKNINKIIDTIKNFEIEIKSTGSIEQSFVTGGGIDIKYIDTKTMESKINPGIYFAGEILDVHGPIGGYNITIALSTGYLVGESV